MSYIIEQVFPLIRDNPPQQRLLMNECIEYSNSLAEFLSKMNYQSSEMEYQTSCLLYEEYMDFCKEHHFKSISRIVFLRQLKYLGFKVKDL